MTVGPELYNVIHPHDPLCKAPQYWHSPGTASATCQCDLIAKVVAREQERHGNNCGGMWDEWTHDLRAKVEALPGAYIAAGVWENPPIDHDIDDWDGKPVVLRSAVLALIDGSSDG